MTEPRQAVLMKAGHTYVFRCQRGDEDAIIDDLIAKASDKSHPLDWFDAACISHQMGTCAIVRLGQHLPPFLKNQGDQSSPSP